MQKLFHSYEKTHNRINQFNNLKEQLVKHIYTYDIDRTTLTLTPNA
jgi:hypothetical protein